MDLFPLSFKEEHQKLIIIPTILIIIYLFLYSIFPVQFISVDGDWQPSREPLINFVLLFLSIVSTNIYSQEREFISKEGDHEYHMKMYYMLIYVRGEKAFEFSDEELKDLQKGHMDHIGKMAEAGVVRREMDNGSPSGSISFIFALIITFSTSSFIIR